MRGARAQSAIPRGRLGERNGVPFAFFAVSPAVQDDQHDGTAEGHCDRKFDEDEAGAAALIQTPPANILRRGSRKLTRPFLANQDDDRRISPSASAMNETPAEPEIDKGAQRHAHARVIAALAIAIVALAAMDAGIVARRKQYEAEIVRLRASMSDLERRRADHIVAREEDELRVAIALLRRQARMEGSLHLAVSVDSSAMYLEREGALLREMPVHVGPERRVGSAPGTVHLVPPRGVRTIARILSEEDVWEVPAWVYADRGLPAPTERSLRGALGAAAILLEGGTILYSIPRTGPLNDSAYVLPGAVRARVEDLQAVIPSLSAGMRVYFY